MYQTAGQQSGNIWVFDIETAVRGAAREHLSSLDVDADKRLKDPAKIEESKKEKRQELIDKAPLYWWYGQIVSIAAERLSDRATFQVHGLDEKKNIRDFFNLLYSESEPVRLVGKNSLGFDFGYLVGRCISLDIGVPYFLRPYRPIEDVDQCFSSKSGSCVTGKLSDYAYALGMSKSANGSDVAGMVDRGEWDQLSSYNQQDVTITAEVLRRWAKEYDRHA